MTTEVSFKLGDEAKHDLDGLGRFRSRLLFRALSDELRTLDPSLAADPIPSEPGWRALSIGDYRVIYRVEPADSEKGLEHFVARVVRRENLDEAVRNGLEAEAPAVPAVAAI